jgi:hypothetical protein
MLKGVNLRHTIWLLVVGNMSIERKPKMTNDNPALDALEKFIKLHTAIDDRKSPNFIKRNISEEAFAAKDAFEQIRAIINTRHQPSGDAVKALDEYFEHIEYCLENKTRDMDKRLAFEGLKIIRAALAQQIGEKNDN